MTRDEIQRLSVYSSGIGWQAAEVRFCRREVNVVEMLFRGGREKEGKVLLVSAVMPEPAIVAYELYVGFDHFHIVDLARANPQREVGRFEMHIFRDDGSFCFAFDSYDVEEETANQAPDPTRFARGPS